MVYVYMEVHSMRNGAIVVLHYNKFRLTRNCIESILEAGYPAKMVYCFDNGSKADVFKELAEVFPLCHHLRYERNFGYSGGFNRALDWVFSSGVSSVLFCTNDTIVYKGAMEACMKTARKTGTGLVAPCVIYMSSGDVIDSIGGWFDIRSCSLNHYHYRGLPDILDPERDYIPGTALWIHRDFFFELGGTDESFHMYWEDVDMCFRAHQKKLSLARCYEARIGHGVGQTCRKKPLYTTFYFQRNRIRFCRRNLTGDRLQSAMELLETELLKMGKEWGEKCDKKRLKYLEQLMKELENPFSNDNG